MAYSLVVNGQTHTVDVPADMPLLWVLRDHLKMKGTAVGAVPDILEDGASAYIIRPGDVDALRQRLDLLLRDSKVRLRMGKAARETCRAGFRSQPLAIELINMLDRL